MKDSRYYLTPYPWYDVESMQKWLEEEAVKGWFLKKDSILGLFTAFQRGEPASVRYRMDAFSGEPSGEAVQIAKEMGWEYLTRYGDFAIYCCYDPNAPELNTDSAVEEMSLLKVRRKRYISLFISVLWLLAYLIPIGMGKIWLRMVLSGEGLLLFSTLICITTSFISEIKTCFYLFKLCSQLEKKSSKRPPKKNKKIFIGLQKGLEVVILLVTLYACGKNFLSTEEAIPIEEYKEEIPFTTMVEMGIKGSFSKEDLLSYNTLIHHETPFFGQMIHLSESGSFKTADGRQITGFWFIDYAECGNEWLAREFAGEYAVQAERNAKKQEKDSGDPLLLENIQNTVPNAVSLDVDSIKGYPCYPVNDGITLIMTKGTKAIQVQFYQLSEDTLSVKEWAEKFAEDLNRS